MVELSLLYPGAKIKIVDSTDGLSCWADDMSSYLGAVVTVAAVYSEFITIEEDEGAGPSRQDYHWYWFPNMLDYIVENDSAFEDFDIADVDELRALLLGGAQGG